MARKHLELVLTETGTAELMSGDTVQWASDDDDDFRERHKQEFLTKADLDDILDYLVSINKITALEADEMDCYQENDGDPGEDEEDFEELEQDDDFDEYCDLPESED